MGEKNMTNVKRWVRIMNKMTSVCKIKIQMKTQADYLVYIDVIISKFSLRQKT